MEYVIEFILELLFEFSIEASKSSKIPKFVRILLFIIILSVFIGVIALIFLVGILLFKYSISGGILIILLGIIMLVSAIIKVRKEYLTEIQFSLKKDDKHL